MNVRELKKCLAKYPDHAAVLIETEEEVYPVHDECFSYERFDSLRTQSVNKENEHGDDAVIISVSVD